MYTLIQSQDMTSLIAPESIQIQKVLSDPMSKASLTVDDPGSQLSIHTLQDILILDENGLSNPAWNLLLNPSMNNTDGHYGQSSGGTGPIQTFPGTGIAYTYSNNLPGTFTNADQQIQQFCVFPGVTYCLSVYVVATSPVGLTNAAFITLGFYDAAGNTLSKTFTTITPTTTQIRINAQAIAPDGTAYAIVQFGGQSTTSTNSGALTYTTGQFEPMWFVDAGIVYPTPDNNPAQATSYVLPNGTTVRQTRLFAGQIVDSHRMYDDISGARGAGQDRTHDLACNSAEWLLETTNLVNKSYSNMYDSDIIADILSTALTYQGTGTGQVLPVPWITGHNVVQGYFVTDTITWDGISVREALNQLANLSNFTFYVDDYFDLHYAPAFYGITSFGLSDDLPDNLTMFPYDELEVDEAGSQVRNRIQVNGGTYSQRQVDTFSGNGSNKIFTLTQQPDTMTTITVGGTTQVVKPTGQGTLGSGGLQVQWDKATSKITFNTAPPNAANNVVVTYDYLSPVRVRIWDMQSIANQGGRTYDHKIEDSSLLTPQTAIRRGESEADVWAEPINTYKFKTLQPVAPGQVVPFTCLLEGLASYPLLLQKVTTTSPQGTGLYEYLVEGGMYLPSLIDMLTNTHKALNRSKRVAGLPLLQEVLYAHDSLSWSEDYSLASSPPPPPTPTPLTLYFTATAAGTVATDNALYSASGGSLNQNNTTKLGSATGWGEIFAQGTTNAWAAAGSEPAPSDHGFLWDVTTLEGGQLVAGTYTGSVRLNMTGTGAGNITADIHCVVSKRSSGGTKTVIADTLLTGQTVHTTKTTFAPVFTTTGNTSFLTGDKVQINIFLNVTANAGPSTQTITLSDLSLETSALTGLSTAAMVTPGYTGGGGGGGGGGAVLNPYMVKMGTNGTTYGAFTQQAITDIQALGATSLFFQIPWKQIDTTGLMTQVAANYNWAAYDSAVKKCNAAGIDIYLAAFTPPTQFIAAGTSLCAIPANMATFCQQIAQRYNGSTALTNGGTGTIQGVYVGNEDYDSGAPPTEPDKLVSVMKAVYPVVKAVNSSFKVIAGARVHRSLSYDPTWYDVLLNPTTGAYTGGVFQADVITFHYHTATPGPPYSLDPRTDNGDIPSFASVWQIIQAKMTAYSVTGVEVWADENGINCNTNPGRSSATVNTDGFPGQTTADRWTYTQYELDSARLSGVVKKFGIFTEAEYDGYAPAGASYMVRDGQSIIQGTIASPVYGATFTGMQTYISNHPTW